MTSREVKAVAFTRSNGSRLEGAVLLGMLDAWTQGWMPLPETRPIFAKEAWARGTEPKV